MRICKIFLFIVIAAVVTTSEGVAQSRGTITADQMNGGTDASGQSVTYFVGNVKVKQDITVMLADNAISYPNHTVTATGNIRVLRDGAVLYGDNLFYDGNTKQGVVTGKVVKLVDGANVLVTDAIKFNTEQNTSEYTNGGTITSPDGTLVSQYGYYFRDNKKAVFKGKVVINADGREIKTDSIMYLAGTKTAVFIAPTDIVSATEHMKFNSGRYYRNTGLMTASGSVYMLDEHNREVLADSMEYYREKGMAKLFKNVQIADSARKNYLLGDFASYNKKPEDMLVTDNPAMISISEKGDSLYMRADTLKSLISFSEKGDTIRNMIGYRNVRSYGKDFQAVCDSMFVSGVDSTMTMYHEPLLWSDITQISANEIKFISKKQQLVRADFVGEPFIAQRIDSSSFNQMKGKEMSAFFTNNKITRLDAVGNGQTIYYMQDKEKTVAVNITESQNLSMYFADSTISRITFRSKPESRMIPLDKLQKEEGKLKGLNWKGSRRPASKSDITWRTIRKLGDAVILPVAGEKLKVDAKNAKGAKADKKAKAKESRKK